VRRPHAQRARRREPRLLRLPGRALPAHRSGRDRGRGARRSMSASGRGPGWPAHMFSRARGLRRSGREPRGRGATRGDGRGGRARRARHLSRVAAVAVSRAR
jgi:hypothetical protein